MSSTGTHTHSWYLPLVHISLIPTQKNSSGTQSGDLFQSCVPVLDARKLKIQKTRDELKSVVSNNL